MRESSPNRPRVVGRKWKHACLNRSGVPRTFPHEAVLGRAREFLLPSALTALGKHASRLHFLRKLLSAAPASGLPFLSIALLAHVSCAIAWPIAKAVIMTAKRICFMAPSQMMFQTSGLQSRSAAAD